jgi:hypothetical protein
VATPCIHWFCNMPEPQHAPLASRCSTAPSPAPCSASSSAARPPSAAPSAPAASQINRRPRSPCTCTSRGMLADAGATTVLAAAPLAVMLADAGAPAVLAPADGHDRTSCAPQRCAHPVPLPPILLVLPACPCSCESSACCSAVLPSARPSRHSRQ